MSRKLSTVDRLLAGVDRSLKTLVPGGAKARRASPASDRDSRDMTPDSLRHIAGLMRINHTGEVCAQALYQGQALTARDASVQAAMAQSAEEEIDHLAWCEQRLQELDSHTSRLNPLFYAASFAMGAAAGIAGDRWSLGFVAATEDQVCLHLREHLRQLPLNDERTRAILEQMLHDEAEHANTALAAGGAEFAPPIKRLMTAMSKVMTNTTYYV